MVKRVIYPPIWLVLGLVTIFACNELLPGPRFTSGLSQGVGGALLVTGLWLLVTAGGLFGRAGTDVVPFRNVSTLVTEGVYRYTRNPMYLGMLLVLLGCAVTVGSTYALVAPLLFGIIIDLRFIRAEETMLRQLFPEAFASYCERVRRWI